MEGVRRRGGRRRGKWGGWVAGQQSVLPGDRNSSHKALKGLEKKKVGKVGWKNLWLKISRTFSRIGRTFFMYWPENSFGTWQH
jgi:hypothetical protein